MKCIIYGLGSGRLRIEKYLKDSNEIIGYSDSFYKEKEFNNRRFYKPEELVSVEFDFIIIGIGAYKIRESIFLDLVKYGVKAEKIIDFYGIYLREYSQALDIPIKRVDRVIKDNYEGIILGISHAAFGINPQYLDKKFCNLAVSSQDLYYNLRTLQIVKQKYEKRFRKLQYAIIDMYDYTYFNYDVSLTKVAIQYYGWSGFRSDDNHNYKKNKRFNKTIEELVDSEYEKIIKSIESDAKIINLDFKTLEKFKKLFNIDKIDINYDFNQLEVLDYFYKDFPPLINIDKCISKEEIEWFKKNYKPSSLLKNRYENTIEDNIEIFDKIINTLIDINPNIKIYLVLIPTHKVKVDASKKYINDFKDEFLKLIDKFKGKYGLKFLDFTNYEHISAVDSYYYDIEHLNSEGSKVFTKILNEYIEY